MDLAEAERILKGVPSGDEHGTVVALYRIVGILKTELGREREAREGAFQYCDEHCGGYKKHTTDDGILECGDDMCPLHPIAKLDTPTEGE